MKKLAFLLGVVCAATASAQTSPSASDIAAWEKRAQAVTIVRDDWGIPHIYGKTDADVVFGLMYAQSEDDFNRVETNYINSMGRLAEAEGESAVWRDLRMKLFINPDSMKAKYAASPEWMKKLMNAYADGLNFYLYKHPEVTPRVIKHFEPWMAADLQRRQHRRRYREGEPERAAGVLRIERRGVDEPERSRPVRRADGIERHRDRAVEHERASRAAADQSAHVVLLPRRSADGERRRA